MNSLMPLVSVVIPIYNVECYLPQCLDSVIKQTYKNLEIILIDDGSTDSSGIICDKYSRIDKRICVFHIENRGLAHARNKGLEVATGEYLSYIDSDDWIELNTIETLLNTALKYGAEIVVVGRTIEYVGKTVHAKTNGDRILVFKGSEIIPAYLNGLIGGDAAWNKLYHISCFGDIRYPDGHNYEDVDTTWRIIKRISEKNDLIVLQPMELFHHRRRASSISYTKTISNALDAWKACYEKYLSFYEYREYLVDDCFLAIGKMWGNYAGFTEEEKEKGTDAIQEMLQFSKTHFYQVMRGKHSLRIKMTCLCSQTMLPILMRMYCYGNRVRILFENIQRKPFK